MMKTSEEKKSIANLLQEFSMLNFIPRSGFAFLGSGNQSVAAHTYGTATNGLILARYCEEPIDELRLLQLCLIHDFHEARIGDHNYVQKRYLTTDMEYLLKQIKNSSPMGEFIVDAIKEYEERKTIESKVAHDADQLELLLLLKREWDIGNSRAEEWYNTVEKRLTTQVAKALSKEVRATRYDQWWNETKN